MRGMDVIGVDYGGLVSSIFNTAGAAVDVAQQSEAEKADNNKLQASITADKAATTAVWRANASGTLADKSVADAAVAAQDKAGAAVPEGKRADRVKAAQAAVDTANQDLSDALHANDTAKQKNAQAELDAATQTLDKARGVAPEGNAGKGKGGKGGAGGGISWSTPLVGPVKVWQGLVGLVATVGGVILWKRSHK